MSISPTRMTAVMSQVSQLLAELPTDDEARRYDSLEGETAFFETLDDFAQAALADARLVELARDRIKRIEARAERNRSVVQRMLEIADLKKVERPLFTASVAYRTKPIVTDAALIPAALLRTAPDMHAIAKALKDAPVPGVEVSNATAVLTLRTA